MRFQHPHRGPEIGIGLVFKKIPSELGLVFLSPYDSYDMRLYASNDMAHIIKFE